MKTDVLTLAAIVFVAGLLLSSITASDIFTPNDEVTAPAQQANVSR